MTTPAGSRSGLALLAGGGIVVLALLAVGLGSLVQEIGCNQKAHYALVRALAEGTSIVDEYQPESCDLAYTDGHYYAAKAPGLAFALLPVYATLDAVGALPDDPRTAVWLLGLFGALIPALAAAVIAARLAERVVRSTGLLVGATLLLGTLLLPFSTLLFAHALAAALAVGAFALLWRERLGARVAALAGAVLGLAATVEHPVGLVALPLAAYAGARGGLRAASAFVGGVAVGVAPTLAYNVWSFGSPFHFAVEDTIVVAGDTGHDEIGGHSRGLFGSVAPSTHVALQLLASSKGLLTLSPVLAAATVGLVLLARRGFRAEAVAIGGAALLYFVWNSGLTAPFGGPFGGDSPGARYLVPVLPFLAPGLALAFRSAFRTTAALAGVSIVFVALATATEPMLDGFDTGRWWSLAAANEFTSSVVTLLGGPAGFVAVVPFALASACAVGIAAATSWRAGAGRETTVGVVGAVAAWALAATLAPPLLDDGRTLLALVVLAFAAAAAAVALGGLRAVAHTTREARAAAAASSAPTVGLVAVIAGAALLAWHGATTLEPSDGYDSDAHIEYVEHLRDTGSLPSEEHTYEFASPPAYQWLTLKAQDTVDRLAEPIRKIADGRSGPAGRLVWLALLLVGVALAADRRRVRRGLGSALVALAAAAVVLEVASASAETPWRVGQAISVAATAGLLVVTWLLGRTVWREDAVRPLALVALVAAIPLVFRLGAMFHPESLHAFLAVTALLVVVRAGASGWPLRHAVLLGALLGAAALTRQTILVVVVALAATVAIAARRRALAFGGVAAAVLVVVAGPWWLHQYERYGNPIQSNLEREGYLLEDGQPLDFYVSLPLRDLVLHPYRPAFENELLPMIHADIWSDWFGGQHGYWAEASDAARFFASTQSVLGLPVSILAVVALFAFGVPALRRTMRGEPEQRDLALAASFVVAVLSWAAFVVTLVRFPQAEGDPVKASYMLYLTPVFALVLVLAGSALWRRGRGWRAAIVTWGALYAISYAGFLATAY